MPDIALLPGLAVLLSITIDELFRMPYEAEFERIENIFWQESRIALETFEYTVKFLYNVLRDALDNAKICSYQYK